MTSYDEHITSKPSFRRTVVYGHGMEHSALFVCSSSFIMGDAVLLFLLFSCICSVGSLECLSCIRGNAANAWYRQKRALAFQRLCIISRYRDAVCKQRRNKRRNSAARIPATRVTWRSGAGGGSGGHRRWWRQAYSKQPAKLKRKWHRGAPTFPANNQAAYLGVGLRVAASGVKRLAAGVTSHGDIRHPVVAGCAHIPGCRCFV